MTSAFRTSLQMFIVALTFGLLLNACATASDFELFRHLRLGMDKGQVADVMGDPEHKEHHDAKDWWYYNLTDEGLQYERMVLFEDGKMVYAGRVTIPKYVKPAEKADAEFRKSNQGIAPQLERERLRQNNLPDQPFVDPQ